MTHRIIQSPEILIVGMKATMSFSNISEETGKLARQFMSRLKEIRGRVDDNTLSLQNYDDFDYTKVSPTMTFEKWVGVEVDNLNDVPEGMETLTINSGRYLVIDFKGSIQEFVKNWNYLHSQWLPNSEYELDNRPHFEKLSPSYSPMNAVNQEEIWIPVI
ncbi:GyrI-like domain-containing protein [Flavobacteriaceae bacterium S0825]|uniref:GyrI-like domain-containing protein n=1 Tax=Gaetbulibacter sp. S0825 TaxID=2720084 RepID=UPI0014311603|nr:GyrI-like domain-containing protein [Gaetbulibacter sp. S0825]MCK0108551.1 GyrI-like domain-containing protein [Flavobacteriaceae bacterium S0825]NIX64187.1 GyrI-like domain-containing protein [Gaetbulibacter sp. S0825]